MTPGKEPPDVFLINNETHEVITEDCDVHFFVIDKESGQVVPRHPYAFVVKVSGAVIIPPVAKILTDEEEKKDECI